MESRGKNIETIQQLQRHPWIVDPFNDGGKHGPFEKREHREGPRHRILEWNSRVEMYQKPDKMAASMNYNFQYTLLGQGIKNLWSLMFFQLVTITTASI